jgi:RNA polymerase sigma-70 factor (ECF subfamily)
MDERRLLDQARAGEHAAWEALISRHRAKLRRMIEFRIHPRLQGRVDASDVIQETFVEAARAIKSAPIANEQHHETPQASSYSIARFLVGDFTSPSNAAIRDEKRIALEAALEQLEGLDREVLVLRHFEQLSGPESAEVLGLSHDVVKKRYVRALEKLQRIMAQNGISE